MAAARGADVLAIDAAEQWWSGSGARAEVAHGRVRAEVMDGTALGFPDAAFDAALSVFGVILFPDAAAACRDAPRARARRPRRRR